MTAKYKWIYVGTLERGGHRVFWDENSDRLAIRSEEGVLWIRDDGCGNLVINPIPKVKAGGYAFSLPLWETDGKTQIATIIGTGSIDTLIDLGYKVRVKLGSRFFVPVFDELTETEERRRVLEMIQYVSKGGAKPASLGQVVNHTGIPVTKVVKIMRELVETGEIMEAGLNQFLYRASRARREAA